MADLNIKPDPTVIALQFGIFLATLYSVKKLILEPYLSMREQRQTATTGQKEDADELLGENQKLADELKEKYTESTKEIREHIASLRQQALEQRSTIVKSAETSAKELIAQMQVRLRDNLAEERAKLPRIIEELAGAWYKETLH